MTPIVQVRDGRRSRLVAAAVAGAFALLLLMPHSAHAANATWPQNTALVLTGPGITLQIDANSTASSLAVTATTFTVVTSATDSFVVRYANPAGKLTNDGNISECNTQAGGDNLVTVGPSKSITFTPSTTSCGSGGSGGGGGSSSVTPTVSVILPNGGEQLASGTSSTIQWQTNGGSPSTMRLWLSTDSGVTYPTLVAQNESNDGSYTWAVPTITTTMHARVKVEAMSGTSSVLSSDTSNADFTITGTAPTTTPPPATTPPAETQPVTTPAPATDSSVRGVYRAIEAISHNPSINDDKGLAVVQAVVEKHCTSGDLIKASQPSVYYCGSDGRRYVFVNEKAFKTWFTDFKSVKTLSDSDLSAIPIGGNVTYRPGVRMIKIQSDPKVYAISRGGTLRWVSTENAAKILYGDKWNKNIDDVSDAFFVNYKIGDDIKDSDVDPTTAPPASSTATSASVTSASTSTTTSCTVASPFTAYLSSGSSDPEVAPLQGLLQCLGYIHAGTSLTGYYGAATETAVKQFQKANALAQVGYVGPSTRDKLNQFVK